MTKRIDDDVNTVGIERTSPMLDQESLHPKTRDTVLAEKKEAALEEEPKEPIFAPPPIVMDPNNDEKKEDNHGDETLEAMEKSVEEDNSKAEEKAAAAARVASAAASSIKKGGNASTERKVITLHTSCSPLERLNFDPREWNGVVGARIAVARLNNPNLSFSKSIEMRATKCGSYEIEEEGVLEDGDYFGFYLYPIANKESQQEIYMQF